jgi:hypothetical protein
MAAVRADDRVDLGMLNELASHGTEKAQKYSLAAEVDFATRFEHVEIGAPLYTAGCTKSTSTQLYIVSSVRHVSHASACSQALPKRLRAHTGGLPVQCASRMLTKTSASVTCCSGWLQEHNSGEIGCRCRPALRVPIHDAHLRGHQAGSQRADLHERRHTQGATGHEVGGLCGHGAPQGGRLCLPCC